MANDAPNKCSGAASDSVHRMTTKEHSVTTEFKSPSPIEQRVLHEHLQVVGDALIGVVGSVAEKLHAVMVGGIEPLPQIGLRHPAPPADLEPQIEVVLIDREHGINRGDHAEEQACALTKAAQLWSCSVL